MGRFLIVIGRRLSKRKSVRWFDGPTWISLIISGGFSALLGLAASGTSGIWDSVRVSVFATLMFFPFLAFASIPIGLLKGLGRKSFEDGR